MADEERTWDLRNSSGEVVVSEIQATSGEMVVVVDEADEQQPQNAPHYATDTESDERVGSDDAD